LHRRQSINRLDDQRHRRSSQGTQPEHFDHLESTNTASEKRIGLTPFPDVSTKIEM